MYELIIPLQLPDSMTGLDLRGQLVDSTGAPVGGEISAQFVELGGGSYLHTVQLDESFSGGIKYYPEGSPSTVLVGTAINSPGDLFAVWEASRNNHATRGIMGESFLPIVSGEVTGEPSINSCETDLPGTLANQYNRRTLVWVTGILSGSANSITGYDPVAEIIMYRPMPSVPEIGDRFVIV